MMQIKWLPTAITAAAVAALLFGGWFFYQNVAVERPLDKLVNTVDGVASSVSAVNGQTVSIELKLKPDADMSEVVQAIKEQGASMIGSRELKVSFDSASSEKLDKIWSSVLFPIAESMEKREYSGITDTLEALRERNPGLQVYSGIDETNVYIALQDGEASKYIVLPRVPATMGVWNHA